MRYSEVGFRAVCGQFVAFDMTDKIRKFADSLTDEEGRGLYPGGSDVNCILTYGYVDHEAGVTLEVLALGTRDGDSFGFYAGNPSARNMMRIGYVSEEDFELIDDADGALGKIFAEQIARLDEYRVNEYVEESRNFDFLDSLRDELYIDDVKVELVHADHENETVWVRIEDLDPEERGFVGTLLNEPYQNMGVHKGDTLEFYCALNEEFEQICYVELTPDEQPKTNLS